MYIQLEKKYEIIQPKTNNITIKFDVEYLVKSTKILNSNIEIDLDLLKCILEKRKKVHIEHGRSFNLNCLKNILLYELYEVYGDDYLPTDSLENSEKIDIVNLDELVYYFKYLID